MKNKIKVSLLPIFLCTALPVFSATLVKLNHVSTSTFTNMLSPRATTSMMEVNRHLDFNRTLHIRMQETYQGKRVWGGEGVMHIANAQSNLAFNNVKQAFTLNGKIYQNMEADLQNTPRYALNNTQAQKISQQVIRAYETKINAQPKITNVSTETIVYIDKDQKANWAYLVKFDASPHKARGLPERPIHIVNATTGEIYKSWNDIKTLDDVDGGGNGGNRKMGKITYDGKKGNFPALKVQRDAENAVCYLQNSDVTVHDMRKEEAVMEYACKDLDKTHGVYWSGEHDANNGAYSPGNDALYEGGVIKDLYKKWYGLDVLMENGKPMMLDMFVHEMMENAYWDGKRMVFGDGDGFLMFYPLTSLDVAAHEVSHGFTEQHANLTYEGQSGGLNESFSDMASQAAYFYSDGKNPWTIGADITLWLVGDALRYMDIPSKDCTMGRTKGKDCSIDDADEYKEGVDVHFSSGVYNRMFYLLSISKDWTTRKAFDVMVKANMDYWTPNATFDEAACGVVKAADDLKYDVKAVKKALMKVGIEPTDC